MATYYVRITGSDSNDGLTPATAWRTFSKVFGTGGVSSGDTVYIGAGIYRETVSMTMTSPTAETFIIGDSDGFYTGDAGEILLTARVKNDNMEGAGTLLNTNGKTFLTFQNILFGGSTGQIISSLSNSVQLKFLNCGFFASTTTNVSTVVVITDNTTQNVIFDSCLFFSSLNNILLDIRLARNSSGSDYYSNVIIKNCLFLTQGTGITIPSSGSGNSFGGGIKISNCTFHAGTAVSIGANTSTLIPNTIVNCIVMSQTALSVNAGSIGSLIENYNRLIATTVRTNVSIGAQSIALNTMSSIPNLLLPPSLSFYGNTSLLSLGDKTSTDAYDMFGNDRTFGALNLLFKGTLTSVNGTSITDSSQNFSALDGYNIKMLNGPAKGCAKTINGNTQTVITGDGSWPITPNVGDRYVVYAGGTALTSKVSSSSNTYNISDNYSNWGENFWQGYTLEVVSGVASGQNFIVSGNGSNSLTGHYPLSISPVSGDIYHLYWGGILKSSVSTGTNITLTDNNAVWPVNFWQNFRCMITEGVASGANFAVSGNSPNTLSGYNVFLTIPQTGDKYVLYQNTGNPTGYYESGFFPRYGVDYIQCAMGAYQRGDMAIRETGIVLSGANSIQLFGPGFHDFKFPASGQTTVSVFGYFDDCYSGVKPQLIVRDGLQWGVQNATGTMTAQSGAWERLSLTFTPSGNAVMTARVVSNATGIGGSAYFDCFAVE